MLPDRLAGLLVDRDEVVAVLGVLVRPAPLDHEIAVDHRRGRVAEHVLPLAQIGALPEFLAAEVVAVEARGAEADHHALAVGDRGGVAIGEVAPVRSRARRTRTSFCQTILPSARDRQSKLRIVPLLLALESTLPFSSFFGLGSLFAWVRKILSPQMMGVELPGNSSATFHFTFSLADHLSGKLVSEECPCPVGPRHAGQFSARTVSPSAARSEQAASARMVRMG